VITVEIVIFPKPELYPADSDDFFDASAPPTKGSSISVSCLVASVVPFPT